MGTYLVRDRSDTSNYLYVTTPSQTISVTATGDNISITLPAVQARGQIYMDDPSISGQSSRRYRLNWGDPTWGTTAWSGYVSNTSTNATIASKSYSVGTNTFFNSTNPTVKTVKKTVQIWSADYNSKSYSDWTISPSSAVNTSLAVSVTLNAPPTFTVGTMRYDKPRVLAGITTASVDVSSLSAKYYGTISSVKLTIGSQTATRTNNGTLSIKLNEAGTFTPTVVATDSRGQTTTKTLSAITVEPYELYPTFDTTPVSNVSIDTDAAVVGYTTASITVSNATAYYGGTISSIALSIGNNTVTRSDDGVLEMPLTQVGVDLPVTISATDSWGKTTTKTLDDITVNAYNAPTIRVDKVQRVKLNSTANPPRYIVDDEGVFGLITAQMTWTSIVADLEEPTVYVNDGNGDLLGRVDWYSDASLSTQILDWSDLTTSPFIVYGVLTGYETHSEFDIQQSYHLTITPRDTIVGDGMPSMQMLDTAFYTIDFLAGGHGIAFGQPCTENGFWCDMDSYFNPLIGVVQMYAGQTAPNGWLKCDGSAVSRTTYAKLFAVIGTTYGSGDGSTTFNLPNLQGRVPVGVGTNGSASYALGAMNGSPDAIVVRHTHTIKRTTDVGVAAHGITQPAFTIPNHTHKWKGWNGLKSGSSGTTKEVKSRAAISTDPEDNATTSSGGGGACTRTTNVSLTNNHSVTQPVFSAEYTGTANAEIGANMQPYVVMNYIIHVGVPTLVSNA